MAAQIDELRGARSHEALAAEAGLARQRVTEAIGGGNVTLATLQRIADALGSALTIHPGADPPKQQDGRRQRAHRKRREQPAR